jgi:hypothetical protein
MTEEEVAALEASASEDRTLTEAGESHLLAETARSILGLGAGKKKEPAAVEEERNEEG